MEFLLNLSPDLFPSSSGYHRHCSVRLFPPLLGHQLRACVRRRRGGCVAILEKRRKVQLNSNWGPGVTSSMGSCSGAVISLPFPGLFPIRKVHNIDVTMSRLHCPVSSGKNRSESSHCLPFISPEEEEGVECIGYYPAYVGYKDSSINNASVVKPVIEFNLRIGRHKSLSNRLRQISN